MLEVTISFLKDLRLMEQRHYSKTPVKDPYLETGNIPIRFILMISEETSKLERWIEIIESAKRKKKPINISLTVGP